MLVTLTVVDEAGNVATIRVPPSTPIRDLASSIEGSLNIPAAAQDLRFNNRPLSPSLTVSSAGLSENDLILVLRKPSSTTNRVSSQPNGSPSDLLRSISGNRPLMDQLRRSQPGLHSSIETGDVSALQRILDQMRAWQAGMGAQGTGRQTSSRRTSRASNAPADGQPFVDPMSADAQKAIEERIRQQNVMDNMEAAMEHNPESFGSVVMLFVDCKVNSKSVKAFVDSGAQATIISKECAERCNILRLLDSRFAGVAHGVGTARIHGRIHLALLTLGTEVFEVSFTVMDAVGGGYDMLLGLDMLRKHQASIDLRNNCLRIGASSVPFLPEKDIPMSMRSNGEERERRAKNEMRPRRSSSERGSAGRTASQSSGRSSGSSGRRNDGALARLMDMGFSQGEASEALAASGGDADGAAAILAAKKYGF